VSDIRTLGPQGLVGLDGKEIRKVMEGEVSQRRQITVLKEMLARQHVDIKQIRAILAAVVQKDGGKVTLCAADLNATQEPGFSLHIQGDQETGEMRLETFVQVVDPPPDRRTILSA